MASKAIRGSIWKNSSKKKGFAQSFGSYVIKDGDRYFKLTAVKSGKTRVYESPAAAIRDGWSVLKAGK